MEFQDFDIGKVVIHPDYAYVPTLRNDIALIRLKRETDNLLVVTRGPLVWIVANRTGEGKFTSQFGDVVRSDNGDYILTRESGTKLAFDVKGQLQRLQPRIGPAVGIVHRDSAGSLSADNRFKKIRWYWLANCGILTKILGEVSV